MSRDNTFILSIDQGTSGTMAALLDLEGRLHMYSDIPVRAFYPREGWVEQDPYDLVESIRKAVRKLFSKVNTDKIHIVGFGIANQGESFLLWDRKSGKPLTNVINWQDVRGDSLCHEEKLQKGKEEWFHDKTGLLLDPEWPLIKVLWLYQNNPEIRAAINKGTVVFGQLDAWFLYALSGGAYHCSDHSTASRSGFYNIHSHNWDRDIIENYGLSNLIFPELVNNTARFEKIKPLFEEMNIPWVAGALDQSIALMGQLCLDYGDAKITYGTCTGLWCNIGKSPALVQNLTTSVAWRTDNETVYALAAEGGAAGSIVNWLIEQLDTGWDTSELSSLAAAIQGNDDLMFVPAFNGLGVPYWESKVRGTLFGIGAGTKPEHILRAGLNAVAFGVKDMLEAIQREGKISLHEIVADGGMTKNDYLMQKQSDVLNTTIRVPKSKEGTTVGIGYLAGIGLGLYSGTSELKALERVTDTFSPSVNMNESMRQYVMWKLALKLSIEYYREKHNLGTE